MEIPCQLKEVSHPLNGSGMQKHENPQIVMAP